MRKEKYEKKTGRPGKRGALIAAIVLMAGLILSPVLSQVTRAVNVDLPCSLTVLPGFDDEDVAKANIVIDLYKVADVKADPQYDTYNFVVDGEGIFKDVKSYLENMKDLDSERYQQVANTAAEAALDNNAEPVATADAGEKATLDSGLYLMIARGKNMKVDEYRKSSEENPVITIANSFYYQYSYLPQLVALPNTAETILPDQEIKTSDGEWKYDITATLKGERKKRFGWFEIEKDLKTYESRQPATFIFEVKAVMPDNTEVYNDVVSIVFDPTDGAGVKKLIFRPEHEDGSPMAKDEVLVHIPADATVEVTEIYSGANYKIDSSKSRSVKVQPVIEDSPNRETAKFVNEFNDTDKGGGSITNKFSYVVDKDGNKIWDLEKLYDDGTDDSEEQ